jgi:hypothetical protein
MIEEFRAGDFLGNMKRWRFRFAVKHSLVDVSTPLDSMHCSREKA